LNRINELIKNSEPDKKYTYVLKLNNILQTIIVYSEKIIFSLSLYERLFIYFPIYENHLSYEKKPPPSVTENRSRIIHSKTVAFDRLSYT